MTVTHPSSLAELRLERLRYLRELQKRQKQLEETDEDRLIKPKWRDIARPDQLAPPGDWFCWLILAGRGWGKSRTAAEWTAEKARQYPAARIALVGKTFADVRDTMIEGESGLLQCFEEQEFLHGSEDDGYNRSRLEVKLSNKSVFKAFSAEKPWRLRGPQHHFAWADESCFISGTMIRVPGGVTEIDNISIGDLVMTRRGPRPVTQTGSRVADVFTLIHEHGSLIGTADHPVMTQRGWVALHAIQRSDTLIVWESSKESYQPSLMNITSLGTKQPVDIGIGSSQLTWIRGTVASAGGIVRSGGVSTVSSDLDSSFITGMMCQEMTSSATWCHSPRSSTMSITHKARAGSSVNCVESSLNQLTLVGQRDSVTYASVHQRGAGSGTWQPWLSFPACSVSECSCCQKVRCEAMAEDSAVSHAQMFTVGLAEDEKICQAANLITCVLGASESSKDIKTGYSAALGVQTAHVPRQRVYNLTVADEHEYFANDVLVHNCFWQDAHKGITADTTWSNLVITLRLPKRPQWDEDYQPQVVVATTPRPVALLRTSDPDPSRTGLMQRPTSIITRGRTVDNLENLSKTYQENVVAPLLGTRLGRQELDAEILDDVPGALWLRQWFDECRVTDPDLVPDLIRVVIGVDPAVTDGESSAQTGIIIAGAAKNGRGYVLGDFTLRATPMEAMKKIVAVYNEFHADRVVAEVNNGGDYIGTLLKTVDPNVPFQQVRATRGKAIRAEPISSLYEQRRISHVGSFPYLEDQMCSWTPMDAESPDRIDACVWAITALKDLIGGSFLTAYGVTRCESCQHAFIAIDQATKQPRLTCPKCAAPVILGDGA